MTPEEHQSLKVKIVKSLIIDFLERTLKESRGSKNLIPNRYRDGYTDVDFQREMEERRIKMAYQLPDQDINKLGIIADLFISRAPDRDSFTVKYNAILELVKDLEKSYNLKDGELVDEIAEISYMFDLDRLDS